MIVTRKKHLDAIEKRDSVILELRSRVRGLEAALNETENPENDAVEVQITLGKDGKHGCKINDCDGKMVFMLAPTLRGGIEDVRCVAKQYFNIRREVGPET